MRYDINKQLDDHNIKFNHNQTADDNNDNLEHDNVGYGDDDVYDLVDVNYDAEDASSGDGARGWEQDARKPCGGADVNRRAERTCDS